MKPVKQQKQKWETMNHDEIKELLSWYMRHICDIDCDNIHIISCRSYEDNTILHKFDIRIKEQYEG